MISSIIYLISTIILILTFLLIHKSNKKQNLLLWFSIVSMLLFCYNILIVYILSNLYVHSTLEVLSAINFSVSFIFIIYIKLKKCIQKYYIKKIDIVTIIILLLIIIIIGYLRFGFPFKIVYETVDPGTHFWTSMDFFRESILLNKVDTAIDFSSRVFGSYVNTGILFKICYPFVGYINLYVIYIIFDLIMLFLSSISFYFFVRYIFHDKKFLISIIGTIIYLLGYPLNCMLFGFFYCGHVVTLFCILLLFFKFIDNREISDQYSIFFIMMLNIGICFTYYLYTPIIVISEFLYLIYQYKFNKKINFKNLLCLIFFIIFIPLILTCFYFIIPYIGNKQNSIFYQLNLYGYCYNSYLSNFILFLPPIIYYLIYMFKNKKINFEILLFLSIFLFILIIIILSIFDLADQYYASKLYYMLWLLCFVIIFDVINKNIVDKTVTKIYIGTFLLLFIFSMFSIEDYLYDKNKGFGNRIPSSNVLNVYSYNIDKMKYSNITFTSDEINIIRNLYELKATNVINNFVELFNAQRLWLNAFFWNEKLDYPENEVYNYMVNGVFFDPLIDGTYANINKGYNYFVIFYRNYDEKKYANYYTDAPLEVQRRWDSNFRIDYTINNKWKYDQIDRFSCQHCQFIDFFNGVIIIRY